MCVRQHWSKHACMHGSVCQFSQCWNFQQLQVTAAAYQGTSVIPAFILSTISLSLTTCKPGEWEGREGDQGIGCLSPHPSLKEVLTVPEQVEGCGETQGSC